MKLKYEAPVIEEVLLISNVITESPDIPGTLIPGDEIEGGENTDW